MQIRTYNNKTLSVTLDKTETDYLFGEYAEINYDDPLTRYVLNRLLEIADELYDFKLDSAKTVIEVKKTETGCIIKFDKQTSKRQITVKRPLDNCYRFENADALLEGLSQVSDNINGVLFLYENEYYLFCDSEISVLSEFAKQKNASAATIRYFYEHANLLSENVSSVLSVLLKDS